MLIVPRCWIYRLWDANGVCLYVGQTTSFHPAVRINQHANKHWWQEVARADYYETSAGALNRIEKREIQKLNPRHNIFHAPRSLERDVREVVTMAKHFQEKFGEQPPLDPRLRRR